MNSSTRNGIVGARYHSEITRINPVDSKILMFMFSTQLMVYYIINSLGSLAVNIFCVYLDRVINEEWDLL
jgi:hypothetical protein